MKMLLHESSKILQILDRDNPENISIDRSGGAGGFGFNASTFMKGSDEEKLHEEKKLISVWRDLAQTPKVENALMDIWNEAVVADSPDPVSIDLSEIATDSEKKDELYKEHLEKSFSRVIRKMNFRSNGSKIFKDWYVDGRLYLYYETNASGVTAVRFLDPMKLTFVKKSEKEYVFEYEESKNIYQGVYGEKLEIPAKKVLFIPSGLRNSNGVWLSYLNKAVRPINLLQLLENSLVIHRFVRSPERWVFKIDVSSMNRKRAKAYIEKLRNQYRSRFSINSTTGEISAENTTLAMQENIYIPKTGSQNGGHEIETIGGGSSFGDIADVLYYKDEVAMSLNLPQREGQDSTFMFGGQADEISRAEYKWFRFIKWLRGYFNVLFIKLMKVDLIGQGLMTEAEFNEIKDDIMFVYENDSIYEESKRMAKVKMKLENLSDFAEIAEEWYGEEWVRKNILGDTEEEVKKYTKLRAEFKNKNKYSEAY